MPVHVACGRSCLAARERYAACIDAARLSANTRPSHAAEIRLARRAACRIDRGETGFGTNVSPVSVHAHARRIESWSAGFSARGYLLSLPWSTRHTAPLWRKRHGKRPGGSLFPLSPAFKRRLTRAAWRVSRLGKTGVTVTRACTYVSKPRPSPRIVGRRFVPPAISTQDRRQDVSDPGSGTRRDPGPRPGGSLTSWLAVWQPPTLPFGEEHVVPIAGCRRTHASSAAPRGRHVRRQSIGETCAWTAGCLSGRNDDAARDVRRTWRAADGSRCAA